jgi:hypothetical protein
MSISVLLLYSYMFHKTVIKAGQKLVASCYCRGTSFSSQRGNQEL